jgi:hypothetical protein
MSSDTFIFTAEKERQLREAFRDARHQAKQLMTTLDEIKQILGALGDLDTLADDKPYDGPIEINQHFIWQRSNHRAWAHIVVTRIDEMDIAGRAFDERRIHAMVLSGTLNPPGLEAWNEEGRFREAVEPCDEKGLVSNGSCHSGA